MVGAEWGFGSLHRTLVFTGSSASADDDTSCSCSSPNLVGELYDHPQLGPLLVLGQNVALFGRGEAALRRQAELVERDVLGRLVDAALDDVLAFELAGLGGDQPEYQLFVPFRKKPQRLEAAGALAIVFEEIAVESGMAEQMFGDEFVAARGDEGRTKIAAA